MKQEKCLPFELLKTYLKDPDVGDLIKQIKEIDHPLIFCDVTSASELISLNDYLKDGALKATTRVLFAICFAGWRASKQIYRFDPEFWNLLTSKEMNCQIPVEAFNSLPFKNIFIENLGGFVFFDKSYTDGLIELKLVRFKDNHDLNGVYSVKLIPGKTFEECIKETDEETRIMSKAFLGMSKTIENTDGKPLFDAVQALLYICAQNNDIIENPTQKKIYRKPTSTPKDQFKEVRKWDAGEVVIRNLKKSYEKSRESSPRENSSSGWTQRPHMRRAHWHHFWTGKKDGDRKLVLKWVSPTFINADLGEQNPTVNVIK